MENEKIVFLSSEILIDEIPAYAGGLGILSGGILSAARDLNYPLVGITLVYKKGYVRHEIKGDNIEFLPDEYNPADYFRKIDKKFFIELRNGIRIWFTVWEYALSEEVCVYFIDSDVEENPEYLRRLTDRLYIESSTEEKLLKRLLLALGSLKIVEELQIPVKKFHLNESHCGFLAIELYKKLKNIEAVRQKVVFTTHTPLPHGHEKFDYRIVEKYYEIPYEIKILSPGILNLTRILLMLSGYHNAVSWKHWKLLKRDYPTTDFDYITNGVHTKWIAEPLRELYDKYIPGWFSAPEKFAFAGTIDLSQLKHAKSCAKKELMRVVNTEGVYNKSFDETGIIISVRRRITGYKRNDILFYDVERIEKLSKKFNLQILVSGVCHPQDIEGRKILQKLVDLLSVLQHTRLALLLRNGKKYERAAVSGCDLFVHAPLPPFEACGTSWMRAALNAVPTLASKDGGIIEAIIDSYNGWTFGENYFVPVSTHRAGVEEFYIKLEKILQLISENKEEYLTICRNALKTIGSIFNTHRVLKEYAKRAYEK
jgi:starch phosphorylase